MSDNQGPDSNVIELRPGVRSVNRRRFLYFGGLGFAAAAGIIVDTTIGPDILGMRKERRKVNERNRRSKEMKQAGIKAYADAFKTGPLIRVTPGQADVVL